MCAPIDELVQPMSRVSANPPRLRVGAHSCRSEGIAERVVPRGLRPERARRDLEGDSAVADHRDVTNEPVLDDGFEAGARRFELHDQAGGRFFEAVTFMQHLTVTHDDEGPASWALDALLARAVAVELDGRGHQLAS